MFAGLALVAAQCSCRAPGTPSSVPKLVVILVIDQMRADYVDRYQRQWTGGLRRLLDRGAWFSQAAYPYLNTVTCDGHATISTGTVPATHGIVLNEWWNRAEARRMTCTDDPESPVIAYGKPVEGGQSAKWLDVPTLADELRAQLPHPPRVVTYSLKPRSAIMLAGHRADAVTWHSGAGVWLTSRAYATAPVPFIERFVTAHPIAQDLGRRWERLLPLSAYFYEQSAVGATPPPFWTSGWPHVLAGTRNVADHDFYDAWQLSPFSDDYLGRMAIDAVDALELGRGAGTDYLGVSFSALDFAGHQFGPRSHEVQDVLARVDRTIGELLAHLDRRVGRDHYVVALSADHGVAPVAEYVTGLGIDGGRIDQVGMVRRLEAALAPFLGGEQAVAASIYTDLYFKPGIYQRLQAQPVAMQATIDVIRATPGIWRVFRSEDLRERRDTHDLAALAAARSYRADRSGDLILLPKPYWNASGDGTTHGTSHAYDTRVPVMVMGSRIRAGEYVQPASPADIAPTLAYLCGITLPDADGRLLVEALEPAVHSTARPAARAPNE